MSQENILAHIYTTLFGMVLMNSVNAWQWFAGKNTISLEPWAWVLLVATAITSQGIGFILWNKGLIVLCAGTSSMFMNIPPFVAILTGYFVLNQPILFTQVAGVH
ncbi:MAG: EamA family transporter [Bacillota bacterium]